MYILESIQEFGGKKTGIYNRDEKTIRRIRKAEKELSKKGNPDFAIFISTHKISKGDHKFYKNIKSFVTKINENDGTVIDLTYSI